MAYFDHPSIVQSAERLGLSTCATAGCMCGLVHCPLCQHVTVKPMKTVPGMERHVARVHEQLAVTMEGVRLLLCACSSSWKKHYHCFIEGCVIEYSSLVSPEDCISQHIHNCRKAKEVGIVPTEQPVVDDCPLKAPHVSITFKSNKLEMSSATVKGKKALNCPVCDSTHLPSSQAYKHRSWHKVSGMSYRDFYLWGCRLSSCNAKTKDSAHLHCPNCGEISENSGAMNRHLAECPYPEPPKISNSQSLGRNSPNHDDDEEVFDAVTVTVKSTLLSWTSSPQTHLDKVSSETNVIWTKLQGSSLYQLEGTWKQVQAARRLLMNKKKESEEMDMSLSHIPQLESKHTQQSELQTPLRKVDADAGFIREEDGDNEVKEEETLRISEPSFENIETMSYEHSADISTSSPLEKEDKPTEAKENGDKPTNDKDHVYSTIRKMYQRKVHPKKVAPSSYQPRKKITTSKGNASAERKYRKADRNALSASAAEPEENDSPQSVSQSSVNFDGDIKQEEMHPVPEITSHVENEDLNSGMPESAQPTHPVESASSEAMKQEDLTELPDEVMDASLISDKSKDTCPSCHQEFTLVDMIAHLLVDSRKCTTVPIDSGFALTIMKASKKIHQRTCPLCKKRKSSKQAAVIHYLRGLCINKKARNSYVDNKSIECVGNNLFSCTFCGVTKNARNKVIDHVQRIHLKKDVQCDVCPAMFSTQELLNNHLKCHYEIKYIKCTKCDKSIAEKVYKNHVAVCHSEKEIQCSKCDYTCPTEGYLKRHMQNKHGVKSLLCSLCGKGFTATSILKRHVQTVHEGVKFKSVYNPRAAKCKKCGMNILKKNLKIHMQRKHQVEGKATHVCEKCMKCFASKHTLQIHEKIHLTKAERPASVKRLACSICGKKFDRTLALKEHKIFVHTTLNHFECGACALCFRRERGLQNHQTKTCNVNGTVSSRCASCGQMFISPKLLKEHILSEHYNDFDNIAQSQKESAEIVFNGTIAPEDGVANNTLLDEGEHSLIYFQVGDTPQNQSDLMLNKDSMRIIDSNQMDVEIPNEPHGLEVCEQVIHEEFQVDDGTSFELQSDGRVIVEHQPEEYKGVFSISDAMMTQQIVDTQTEMTGTSQEVISVTCDEQEVTSVGQEVISTGPVLPEETQYLCGHCDLPFSCLEDVQLHLDQVHS